MVSNMIRQIVDCRNQRNNVCVSSEMKLRQASRVIGHTAIHCLGAGWFGLIFFIFVSPLVLILHSQGWYPELLSTDAER